MKRLTPVRAESMSTIGIITNSIIISSISKPSVLVSIPWSRALSPSTIAHLLYHKQVYIRIGLKNLPEFLKTAWGINWSLSFPWNRTVFIPNWIMVQTLQDTGFSPVWTELKFCSVTAPFYTSEVVSSANTVTVRWTLFHVSRWHLSFTSLKSQFSSSSYWKQATNVRWFAYAAIWFASSMMVINGLQPKLNLTSLFIDQ